MLKREKKKYLPLLILTLLSWGGLAAIVALVDPLILRDFPIKDSHLGFFLVMYLAWLFLLALILNNTRRAFFYSLGITIFLVLRLVRLGNIVNGLLLLGLLLVIDFYFSNR